MEFSPQDLERLVNLITVAEQFASPTVLRRLRILKTMCEGASDQELVEEFGKSKESYGKIRRQVRAKGLTKELDDLNNRIPGKQQEPKRRGRPGIRTTKEWIEKIAIDTDNIVELAALVMTGNSSIAVIAVKGDITVADLTFSVGDCHWTELSEIDRLFKDTFIGLRGVQEKLDLVETKITEGLSLEFNEGFKFFVLKEGNIQITSQLQETLLGTRTATEIASQDTGFFDRLEGIFYGLRLTRNFIGLMPCSWKLFNFISKWFENEPPRFEWFIDSKTIEFWLRRRLVVRNYLASGGALYDVPGHLWKDIPFTSEINFHSGRLRTRVQVLQGSSEPGCIRLFLQPLPEFGYLVDVRTENAEQLVQQLTKNLLPLTTRYRFTYSPFTPVGTRATAVMPLEFIHGRDLTFYPIRVVLVPRHFLILTGFDIAKTPQVIANNEKPFFVFEEHIKRKGILYPPKRHFVFKAPLIEELILKAFKSNKYGDRLRHHEMWQNRLRQANLTFLSTDPEHLASLFKIGPTAGMFYRLKAGTDISEADNERWAHKLHSTGVMCETLESEQAIRHDNWAISSWKTEPEIADLCDDYRKQCTKNESVSKGFARLVANVDADFLFSEFSADQIHSLKTQTEAWAHQVKELVAKDYWPDGLLHAGRVLGLIKEDFKEAARPNLEDLSGWLKDILNDFADREYRYVLRGCIETGQRLILEEFPFHPCIILSEESILKRWHSFASNAVLHRFIPKLKEDNLTCSFEEAETAKKSRRLRPNSPEDVEDDFFANDLSD